MKALKETENRYYKYVYSTFTQPVLTSNTSATPYFVTDRYNLFDNNTNTGYNSYIGYGRPNCTTTIILQTPTKFTGFTAKQARNTADCRSGLNYILYGSKDGTNYVTVYETGFRTENSYTATFTNNDYYNYYRFYATTKGGYDEDRMNFREISFVGEQRSTIAGTDEDYDFYIEGGKTYVVKGERKYYKYVYEDWTQPILTANTTSVPEGAISTTASTNNRTYSNIYAVMDGVKSGSSQLNTWMTDNTTTAWWQVTFPYKIRITGLTHYNSRGDNTNDRWVTGQYFTSSDKTTPIGDSFTTGDVSWQSKVIENIPNDGILTDTIYFAKTNGALYSGIGELEVTATVQKVVESTSDDYDFYKDTYKALKTYEKGQYYGN